MPKKKRTPPPLNIERNPTGGKESKTINLINCHGIQIGERNVQNVSEDTNPTVHSAAHDRKRSLSQEQLCVLFLAELLENQNQTISYSELEETVTRKLKSTSGKSFRELAGLALELFLIKHNDTFDIFKKGKSKCVRLKRKSKLQLQPCPDNDDETLKDSTKNFQTLEQSSVHFEEDTETEPVGQSDSDKDDEEEWTEVKRKSSRVKPGNKLHINKADERIAGLKALCNFNEGKFASVIKKGESTDILHTPSSEIYEKDPLTFSKDVVCMWNTPQRVQSYIIIGIDSGLFNGIKSPIDEIFYQNLFQGSYFNKKPIYTCYTAYFDERLFGVIEIHSSYGHGAPIAVKQSVVNKNISLHEGDVWARKGCQNVLYKTTDLELSSIYRWFLRSSSESNSENNDVNRKHIVREKDAGAAKRPSATSRSGDDTETSSTEGTSVEKSFTSFWNSVKHFKKGHFVLLAGDILNTTKNLEAIALLPWIGVYDFDVFSSSKGLLNIVQDKLERERHLRLRTWREPVESISEHGTWWCFMRGREEIPDSRTDLKDNRVEDTNIWMKHIREGLYSNCETLARFTEDYTVLTVVVLWPKNEKLLSFMHKFLDRLNETLTCTANIVICLNKEPDTEMGKTRLQTLRDDFSTSLSVCRLNFEKLCQGILNNISSNEEKALQYSLPVNEGYISKALDETDAAWLREDVEVLYLNNMYTRGSTDGDDMEEEVNMFYKGGNLHWFAWYVSSSRSVQIAIERHVMKALEEKIKQHLEEFKTTIVSLFHAPGSGGTTLAQTILWKFHWKVPCIHVKLRTGSTSDDLVRKVSFLHDKTDLPVLILIDGEEESKVRFLSRRLKYAIILYVKRYPYPIHNVDGKYTVYLPGFVTAEEAERLATKFGEKKDDRKRKALEKLKTEVCRLNIRHHLYEFGMTIHLHEFKGIVSYVEGYLQLGSQSSRADLFPWQKCLGYLALVYYYGQTSVPCQFFASLFGKPANYTMTLDDFPHPIQEFVVNDNNESRQNNLRICHFIVAKEILEQLLSWKMKCSKERTERLSFNACRNLSKFCIDFIEYASRKKTRTQALSTTVRFILTKTFIFRDEKDMSENEEQVRRKPVLSKLMIDIPGGKPLFTERLNVLQKLSNSFPDDPNFLAHLGRFYAFCRSDDENEAEKCFKKAIQKCEKQSSGKREEDYDEGVKLSLMHIYHMYGIVKQRYVSKYTRRSQREKVVAFNEETVFLERIEEIVPIAEDACELFRKSRDITPETHQVYTYAYTGEIQVRLQICDFVLRHFLAESGSKSISAFLASDIPADCKGFVQSSVSTIENLFLECYTDVDLVGDDITALRTQVSWYNNLFQRQVISLQSLPSDNGISDRRLRIAAKKLKYGMNNSLTGIENIDDEKDINEIIMLYEENFSDIQNYGLQSGTSKKDLEREYREWIFAIRHEKFRKNYSLEDVLNHVEKWYEIVRSPFSTFYMFVIRSLLGFGTENIHGKTECLINAMSTQEELAKMAHLIIRPKYPREWLGVTGDGIKRLVPGKRHVGICAEDSGDVSVNFSNIALCKGTILHPNSNKLSGMIDFSLDVNSVKVFFIPKFANLEGKRYVGTRVEFNLAFSVQHGFEAYNVKLLKRYGCSSCNAKLEFTSSDSVLRCKCRNNVYKDDLNEVN